MAQTPKQIIDHILQIEGEKYTNDPKDSGGPTKWGVTIASYSNYVGRQATIAEMQNLTRQQAFDFYWTKHYIRSGCAEIHKLSPRIAAEVMDSGVNMGEPRAGMMLQRALNAFNLNGSQYPDIKVDGQIGMASISALRAFLTRRGVEGEGVMMAALNALQGEFYIDLAERRPKDERFAYGWFLHRVVQ